MCRCCTPSAVGSHVVLHIIPPVTQTALRPLPVAVVLFLRCLQSPWNVNMGVLMVVLMEEMQREQQQQHNRGPQGV